MDLAEVMRDIRQYGDPVLRTTCVSVERFDGDLRFMVDKLKTYMKLAGGLGLAAPQIGQLERAFVYREGPDAPIHAVVNPRLVAVSEEHATDVEGCLSISGLQLPVSRPVGIEISYQDVHGHRHFERFTGLAARVIQHEMDHLDGKLILDRVHPEVRREAMRELLGR